MRTIKTYRKVGAFYIACEADLSTSIRNELPVLCRKTQFLIVRPVGSYEAKRRRVFLILLALLSGLFEIVSN